MMERKTILFTVSNDLTFDQRMQRICMTLSRRGYRVELIGRVLPRSLPLEPRNYYQRRIHCWAHKGFLFYAEYNFRLFVHLMRAHYDAVCSIDLDTLPAGCLASLLRRKKRVYDAHEYFTEVPEVVHRPFVKAFWSAIARVCLPFYRHAYTVGPALAAELTRKYDLPFAVVRNVPVSASPAKKNDTWSKKPPLPEPSGGRKVLLYQGALNEGRGIEHLLQALQTLDGVECWLAGEGDLSEPLRSLAQSLGVQDKVRFLGFVRPADLKQITPLAWIGVNLFETRGLNYYYSLANKFFDYVQAGIPVLCINFPEYRVLNMQHEVAVLLDELTPASIASAIVSLQRDPERYERLQQAAATAAGEWNWAAEEAALARVWAGVF